MERCGSPGRVWWWMRGMCLVLAGLAAAPVVSAGQWLVEDAAGAPGETVRVPIHFVADGRTSVAVVQLFLDSPLGRPPDDPLPADGDGLCVFDAYGRVRLTLGSALREAGTRIRVCSVPVRVPQDFRRRVSMSIAHGECLTLGAQSVACEGSRATFLIDGLPRWYERVAVVVPHLAPHGPTQQSLLEFDYADDPAAPPLRSFDVPRPVHVDSIRAPGDWSLPKGGGAPNRAVAALLRAVRPTYASAADLAAGIAAARIDPQVEAVIPTPGLLPFLVYPARPVAGQPFAFWFATHACRHFVPESPDDRVVRVEDGVVQVYVRELPSACGTPPGGEHHTLLNMPGLPAGMYTLHVTGYVNDPEEPGQPWERTQPLQFEVVAGGTVADPVRIPATGIASLLALCLGALVLALRARADGGAS